MFELSKKTNYGLEVMIALAKNFGKGPLSLKEIAKKKRLPHKFLEQIVIPLRDVGLLGAKEGKGGGYFLTRKPEDISVAKVVEVLEGPIEVGQCSSCPMTRVCGQKDVWVKVGEEVKKVVEGKTLADLT